MIDSLYYYYLSEDSGEVWKSFADYQELQNIFFLNALFYLLMQPTTYLDSPNERMSDGSIIKRYSKSGTAPRV